MQNVYDQKKNVCDHPHFTNGKMRVWANDGGASGKEPSASAGTLSLVQILSLGLEDPLEEGMATHSSILAWRIPWTQEPGGLQSMGSQRVGHD